MARHKIKQGDSLWIDIEGDITVADSDWSHWSGNWAIVTAPGVAPVATGLLLKAIMAGRFKLQVLTSDTTSLPVGQYLLVAQVENPTRGYRKEILQDKLVVEAQSIA